MMYALERASIYADQFGIMSDRFELMQYHIELGHITDEKANRIMDRFERMYLKPRRTIDTSSIVIEGIDPSDYPDFCDAYVAEACYTDGTPLTEDECYEMDRTLVSELTHDRFVGRYA